MHATTGVINGEAALTALGIAGSQNSQERRECSLPGKGAGKPWALGLCTKWLL